MSKFTEKQRKSLESNKYVERVTVRNVQYTAKFKEFALKKNEQGCPAAQIWKDAGIDVSLFDSDYFRKCIGRWKSKVKNDGKDSLKKDGRGRPAGKKFKSVEEELAYLRAENDFLKKLRALEDLLGED